MVKKHIACLLVLALLLVLPYAVFAAASSTTLHPIASVKQGESFTIRGTSSLQTIIIQILRPNQTMLEMNTCSQNELENGISVTLPGDAPIGSYTVRAGAGRDVASLSFNVTAKDDTSPTPIPTSTPTPTATPTATPTPTLTPTNTPTPSSSPTPSASMPGASGSHIQIAAQANGVVVIKLENAGKPEQAGVVRVDIKQEDIHKAMELSNSSQPQIKIDIPKTSGVSTYEVNLPATVLTGGDSAARLEVHSGLTVLTLPSNMLEGQGLDSTSSITLTISKVDTSSLEGYISKQIGDHPVIDLNVAIGGRTGHWSNPEAPVQVSVPYQPTREELKNPEHITVWYLDDQGKPIPVPTGKYDAATGMVDFITTHFSRYSVVYVNKTFGDLGEFPWAQHPVEVLASKGVISGTSEDTFTPAAPIKRADYVLLLVKSLNLNAVFNDNFADVSQDHYYYGALGIAKKLGICEGMGDNRFQPEQEISRQDMMAMTARAMKIAGKLNPAGSNAILERFGDAASVASYAAGPAADLLGMGIIEGDGSLLHPLDHATRAETAVMMYRIYNN